MELKGHKIIAVDFDGTLCENCYPEIGEANENVIQYLHREQAEGSKIILWTCRTGELLEQAICWCYNRNLRFDAVNENLPEVIELFGDDTRKVFANEYIDNRNLPVSKCHEKSNIEHWAEKEVGIACREESGYGVACYKSALKAFRNLLEDGHSGMSIQVTRRILNRLILGKPLSPIEDTDDMWGEPMPRNEDRIYQCARMSSLFKCLHPDGSVTFNDVDRFVGVYMDGDGGWRSGLIDQVMNEIFPITMPYYPKEEPYLVYTQEYLTDRKNGDYDTVGIRFAVSPRGERTEVNRFFKETPDCFVEIDEKEFLQRKEMHKARKRKEEK